jgi:hypothetical protein
MLPTDYNEAVIQGHLVLDFRPGLLFDECHKLARRMAIVRWATVVYELSGRVFIISGDLLSRGRN